MRLGRTAVVAMIGLSSMLGSAAASAQSDVDKAGARALALQGADALAANKFAEALDLVSRAERILHAPTHILMIARAQVGLGHFVSAQEAYLKILHEDLPATAPPAFKRAQHDAKDELALVEPKIASLRIVVEGAGAPGASVKMDGALQNPAFVGVYRPVDPGRHEVVATPEGGNPVTVYVDLKPGEKKEAKVSLAAISVAIAPPPPPGQTTVTPPIAPPPPYVEPPRPELAPPPPIPTAVAPMPGPTAPPPETMAPPPPPTEPSHGFFTPVRGVGLGLGILSLGGIGLGAFIVAKGSSTESSANSAYSYYNCQAYCSAAEQASITSQDSTSAHQKTIGVVGFIAGGALLVTGVTMLIAGKPAAKVTSGQVTPWLVGKAEGLSVAF